MRTFLGVHHGFLSHKSLIKRSVIFLSHCSQMSTVAQVLTIGEPIGIVEVKVLTSQTTQYRVWYSCCTWPKSFAPDKNVGDNDSIISLSLKVCELIEQFVLKVRRFWSFLKSCAEFLKVQRRLPRSEVCCNWSTIFPSLFGRCLWDKNVCQTPKNVCVGGTLLPWGAVSWE